MPSGSSTFDDLNDDEMMQEHIIQERYYEEKLDEKHTGFLEDETEPENLMEGRFFF